MQILTTPWRMDYVLQTQRSEGCVFCQLQAAGKPDHESFILHRSRQAFLVLNIYPYTPGHMMAVPQRHVATIGELQADELDELLGLCSIGERLLRRSCGCRSIHVGANLGRAAGAGVPGHLHFHIVAWPEGQLWDRWAEAEVLPETLEVTYARLTALLAKL